MQSIFWKALYKYLTWILIIVISFKNNPRDPRLLNGIVVYQNVGCQDNALWLLRCSGCFLTLLNGGHFYTSLSCSLFHCLSSHFPLNLSSTVQYWRHNHLKDTRCWPENFRFLWLHHSFCSQFKSMEWDKNYDKTCWKASFLWVYQWTPQTIRWVSRFCKLKFNAF